MVANLTQWQVKLMCDSSHCSDSLTVYKAVWAEEKSFKSLENLETTSIQSCGCLQVTSNATEKFARYNGGLTTMTGDVDVRFIALRSL